MCKNNLTVSIKQQHLVFFYQSLHVTLSAHSSTTPVVPFVHRAVVREMKPHAGPHVPSYRNAFIKILPKGFNSVTSDQRLFVLMISGCFKYLTNTKLPHLTRRA